MTAEGRMTALEEEPAVTQTFALLVLPPGGGVRGGAEDAYPPGGVLDDRQDVCSGASQGHGFAEVAGNEECVNSSLSEIIKWTPGVDHLPRIFWATMSDAVLRWCSSAVRLPRTAATREATSHAQ
jgi:hypothetical protein